VSSGARLAAALLLGAATPARADAPLAITVGDSLGKTYPVPYSTPIQGWGADLPGYVSWGLAWRNDAVGGESTKSFIEEGLWAQTLAANPSFVLIELGTNDANAGDHYTDPETTYRANLHQMVMDARAIGAEPILVTPPAERIAGADGFHLAPYPIEAYAHAMIAQAVDDGVGVIDLWTWSVDLYDTLGVPESQALYGFIIPDGTSAGDPDVVHWNLWGADQCAQQITAHIPGASQALAAHLTSATPPPPSEIPALPGPAAALLFALCGLLVTAGSAAPGSWSRPSRRGSPRAAALRSRPRARARPRCARGESSGRCARSRCRGRGARS
jgi:hypothetical protein